MRTALVASVSLLLWGCEHNEPATSTPASSAAPQATTTATIQARPALPTSSPPAASVAPPSAVPASAAGEVAPSATPSRDEWQAAKEVRVTGSTALGCETKRVREWLGVFCKTNDSGGSPMKVTVEKAETLHVGAPAELRHDVTTQASEGTISLVARYVPGTDVEATFSWTDKDRRLVLWWPAGKPEPVYLGSFK